MTSLETRECPKCQATWIGGQHYWYTGKKGNELDLAGLVCNNHGDETCINPCAGMEGGVTWDCLLYTSPSPRDQRGSRMPSSA